LLRTPGSTLVDGQKVELTKPASPSASASTNALGS